MAARYKRCKFFHQKHKTWGKQKGRLKLSCHNLKIQHNKYKMFPVNVMVDTKQIPIAGTQKRKRKESQLNTIETHQTPQGNRRRGRKE